MLIWLTRLNDLAKPHQAMPATQGNRVTREFIRSHQRLRLWTPPSAGRLEPKTLSLGLQMPAPAEAWARSACSRIPTVRLGFVSCTNPKPCSRFFAARPTRTRSPRSNTLSSKARTERSAASMRSTSPPGSICARSPRSPCCCMLRGSACSTCRGTCCARTAEACWMPRRPSSRSSRKNTIARFVRQATNPRWTRWSRWFSPSVLGSAGSGRTTRTASRCGNTTGKSTGARGSTCRKTGSRTSSRRSQSTRLSCRPAKERCCRCNSRPSSLSSSSRSPTAPCSSTSRVSRPASAGTSPWSSTRCARRPPPRSCSPDRCGSRSTTGAIRACCLRCGSPPTGCTTCLPAASRS